MTCDIIDLLLAEAKPSLDLFNAAIEMQHVADRIKEAVGAPYRPVWCDPTITAKELAERDYDTLRKAADEIKMLREWHADNQRLVRDLDVSLNGEDGTARQASLCDIVRQVKDGHWKLVRQDST